MTKSEQTKAFIIEKTSALFNQKGYAGTSMSDITAVTRLTKGSIYGNFSSKEEVALAVFDYNLGKVNSILRQEIEKASSAKEKLLVYAKVYAGFTDYPFTAGGCPVLNTATESDDTHPALRKKAAAAVLSWKKQLKALIEKGMAAKEFRKDIDAEQTALTIIALIEGGIMIWKLTEKTAYRTAIMQSLSRYISQLG